MEHQFANRIKTINPSVTSAIREAAQQEINQGAELINLAAGELKVKPPEQLIDALSKIMYTSNNLYTDVAGLQEFREVLSRHHNSKGVSCDINNFLFSNGAKHALHNVMQLLINPGDEVIISTPSWQTYHNQVMLSGGKVVEVDTSKSGYVLSKDSILNEITNKTKAIVLTLPGNPTGRLLNTKKLLELQSTLTNKSIYLILDMAYHRFCFNQDGSNLFNTFKNEPGRIIFIDSLSKAFAITGWRVGYVLASQTIINKLRALQSHTSSNVNSLIQAAFVQLGDLSVLDYFCFSQLERIKLNADLVVKEFETFESIVPVKPDGGFYVFCVVDVNKYHCSWGIKSDNELCRYLVKYAGVVVTPGSAFGCQQGLRISICGESKELALGINNIKNAIGVLLCPMPGVDK